MSNWPSGCAKRPSPRVGIGSQVDWIKYRNIVFMRQMEGDKTLITPGIRLYRSKDVGASDLLQIYLQGA